jgi:hypothetical protein
MENLEIDPRDLRFIRQLPDFDLIMLLSDIHDHGWSVAYTTLCLMRDAKIATIVDNA